jgi:flagellar protein FliL
VSTTTLPQTDSPADETGGRPRRRLVLGLVLALVGTLAAGWFLVLRPSGPEQPVPGEVVTLEPIQINLAAGHYLRIGLALQLTEGAHDVDGSRALDATIDLFSGVDMAELTRAEQRNHHKDLLQKRLDEAYHGDVMGVYFTEFVTQ